MRYGTLKQAGKILSLFEDTPAEQVQAILSSGLLADLRDGNIAEVNRDKFRKLLGLKSITPPLLEFVGTVNVPATTERFVARDKFFVDTSRTAAVKIAYIGDNFRGWFLGKIEEPAPEMTLRYARLTRPALVREIRAELGAEREETTLAHLWLLLEKQPNGEDGPLFTNSAANIFYIRDVKGGLRVVDVYWDGSGGGWLVNADSVEYPDRWFGGRCVFSRNS